MVPPVILAAFTDDLETLVGITGSYAGAGIQYVIPVALVYCSRKEISRQIGASSKNIHRLKINSIFTQIIVMLWTVVAVTFVTYNHIVKH